MRREERVQQAPLTHNHIERERKQCLALARSVRRIGAVRHSPWVVEMKRQRLAACGAAWNGGGRGSGASCNTFGLGACRMYSGSGAGRCMYSGVYGSRQVHVQRGVWEQAGACTAGCTGAGRCMHSGVYGSRQVHAQRGVREQAGACTAGREQAGESLSQHSKRVCWQMERHRHAVAVTGCRSMDRVCFTAHANTGTGKAA